MKFDRFIKVPSILLINSSQMILIEMWEILCHNLSTKLRVIRARFKRIVVFCVGSML